MGKACCFSLGIVISCFSLIFLILAISSNYWYVVEAKPMKDNAVNTFISNQPFLYPSNVGLWITCYDKNIPDSVLTKNLAYESCYWNYDFSSKQLEDFARTSAMSLPLACAIILFAVILASSGALCEKCGLIRIGGILLFLSCLITFVGICSFIGRKILERKDVTFLKNQNKQEHFGWAFYVGWISLFSQGLAGAILIKTASKFQRIWSKSTDNFE